MRLHILSDIHLEFAPFDPPPTPADVIVLAGDIHVDAAGVEWAQRVFPNRPVLYVAGNHEFYRCLWPELIDTLRQHAAGSRLAVLENTATEIDGFTFLGCTLWTDYRLVGDPAKAEAFAHEVMPDYRQITCAPDGRALQVADLKQRHAESVAWLRGEFARHDPARTVVITHHAPSGRSLPQPLAGHPLASAFGSDLDALIESSGVALWIHGHSHHSVDYQLGRTRIVANQRGYPDETNTGFDPGFVVDLP